MSLEGTLYDWRRRLCSPQISSLLELMLLEEQDVDKLTDDVRYGALRHPTEAAVHGQRLADSQLLDEGIKLGTVA